MAAPPPPGQGPTPEQIAQMQAHLAAEARKRGLTPQQFQEQQRRQLEAGAKEQGLTLEQYVAKLKAEAIQNHQRQAEAQQQQPQTPQTPQTPVSPNGQRVEIRNDGTVDPRALAVAKWLSGQDLKTRTCLLNGQRKDMFRVKRALRAIESPAYAKAAAKPKSKLPELSASMPATEILKLLPLSFLAVRVSKIDPNDPHAGHAHHHDHDHDHHEDDEHEHPPPAKKAKGKRVKGLWTVRIEPQQDIAPDLHYALLYEGAAWKTKLYALGALAGVFAVVLFPLWPLLLRRLVWQASMGMLGLIALFFAMAIVRLILFCATVFTVPPGLWLYPNLFEDVGFFDSFRPVWGWHETEEAKKKAKKAKREARRAKAEAKARKAAGIPDPAPATSIASAETEKGAGATTAAEPGDGNGVVKRAHHASVEAESESE